jgi:cell division septal protein FtsQ
MARHNRIRASRKMRRSRGKNNDPFRGWVGKIGKGALSLIMLVSLTILGFQVYQYFQRTASLNVGEIKIMGCLNAKETELLNLARINFKDSLMNLDLKELSRRISQHPWVDKAKVRRDWSRMALIIEVQERVPLALILFDDLYFVDRHGEVFKKAGPKDRIDLPVFTGLRYSEVKERDKGAMSLILQGVELLELLGERKVLTLRQVSEIHLSKKDGLTLFTTDRGMPIRVGIGKLSEKITCLEKVLPDVQQKYKEVEYVDLNYPRKVVVKMKEKEKEKFRSS